MKKIILSIDGMTCSACSNGLEKYLNKQDGIINASVNLVMATASIEYSDEVKISDIERFIKEAGFKSLGIAKLEDSKQKTSTVPIIIFGLLAVILMYVSMSAHLNLLIPSFLNAKKYPINYAVSLLIMTIPFVFYGFDIIKNGVKNLINKMPNMDTLVGLGVISSFLYSLFSVFMVLTKHNMYIHSLYFESTAFVIYFIKLGRLLDKHSKEKTKDAIKKLVTITPKTAKIKTEDGFKEVTIDEVRKDDILICYPGEKIAVDGQIIEGRSHFDESFITGEAKPILKSKNDKVIAGAINYEKPIVYQAKRIGKDSTISEIVNLVVEATNTKAPISMLADKLSSYFVPIIIALAILTFIINILLNIPFNISLTRFVTVLVVACPCALGLATPLAIVVSEGVCAKKGILIKKSETLEIISKIKTIIFDKTGTLTNGNLTISKFYNYSTMKDNELLSILATMEKNQSHPIAKGIINYVENKKINYKQNIKVELISGYGIKMLSGKSIYYAGSSKLLEKLKIKNIHKQDENILLKEGNSIVYLIKNNKIIGLLGVKDTIRKNSQKLISTLEKMKINTILLTGDNKESADLVANSVGIKKVFANTTPQEKSKIVKEIKDQDKKVIMVGDGINDAPSLALADVGISLSSATEIATDSSDVILMNADIMRIIDLITISKKTIKNIKQNLLWACVYNISMIPIAMGLFTKLNITINPMIACIAMILSSLFVTLNSLRLRKI